MPDTPPPPIGFRFDYLPESHQSQIPAGASNLIDLSYSPHELAQPISMPLPILADIKTQENFNEDDSNSSSSSDSDEVYDYNTAELNIIDEDGCTWQVCSCSGPFPEKMIRAGVDSDGSPIFAGRAFHEGDMIPAKIIPSKNAAYVCYGGEEHLKEDFEVLRSGEFVWEFCANGTIPEGAIQMGSTADGEPLYMGRAMYQGSQTPGKVQPSHGCLYIPWDGQEVSITEYEVLCLK